MDLITSKASAAHEADRHAAELVGQMSTLPPGPDRERLRAQAIEAWLPLTRRLARRYVNRGEAFDDLAQAAAVGLIKSIDGFDPCHGADFVGYAIPTILGEIKRHFRDRAPTVRIPRRLQELTYAIRTAQSELQHTLSRPPTVTDIAEHLHVDEEAVLEALESGHAYRPASLNAPTSVESDVELGDTLGSRDRGFELTDFRVSLPAAMAQLPERERDILMLRFHDELTQAAIAERVGVSQMQISRLLSAALSKLRYHLGE